MSNGVSQAEGLMVSGALLEAFRVARDRLRAARDAMFPPGTGVMVESDGIRGPGVVVKDLTLPADAVAVRASNGGTWCFGIEEVRRLEGMETVV